MKNLFRNLPVKRKLTIISMMTSGVALLLTCGAIVGFELISSRKAMLRSVFTTATMIGDNSAAALTFGDAESAEQTLQSLSAHEHITAAFIYDTEGKVFARYQPPGVRPLAPPGLREKLQIFSDDPWDLLTKPFADGYVDVFREIRAGGEPIGTLYLRHDMDEVKSDFVRLGCLVLSVMVIASLIALVLSRRLLMMVAGPIVDLEQVVRDVAYRQDFGIRAVKSGNDEVGRLIDGFNEMIGEIQRRDTALKAAQDSLEKRVYERTEELATSLAMLNATLESTADGILALDLRGKVICYNSKLAAMWGFPPEMLQRQDEDEWLAFAASLTVNPKRFLQKTDIRTLVDRTHAFDVVKLKDGRTFERYVQTQQVGETTVGRVINYRDVTRRKRAEAELAETSRQLLETSRRAGMAEVATSVLHNVGNVLNSVNVSCSVVADRVRQSRIGTVARTAGLLRENSHDLPGFLTSHPTGKNFPAFLEKLAAQLATEQAESLRELKLLGKNLDHIKEIVAMQQSYAKVSGVHEAISVADLVEDSLRMNEGSLRQRTVEVIREVGDAPRITVERHKALQILVNLIRNAGHACDDSLNPEKRITIRVTTDPDHVAIAVIDNGVGIPPENLTRIFAHGFTTKLNGHGFGLHNGALAAREMGGSITVESDGPGCGATFTLQLPLNPPEFMAPPADASQIPNPLTP
jgi:PAS domain S-box-containing protein